MFKNFSKVMNKPTNELTMLDKLYLIALAALTAGGIIVTYGIKEKVEDWQIKRKTKSKKA